MEMYRAILMMFRHKDILQTASADAVIQPYPHSRKHRSDVIPFNLLRVKRQRDKIRKLIAERNISHARSGTPPGAFEVGGIRRRLLPSAALRLRLRAFPSRPKNGTGCNKNFKAAIRVDFDSRIAFYSAFCLMQKCYFMGQHDDILS